MRFPRRNRAVLSAAIALSCVALFGRESSSEVLDGVLPAEGLVLPAVGELGGPGRELSPAEEMQFVAGLQLFDHDFHKTDGLGTPEFNADSCRACHQDPVVGGAGGLELNVSRFGFDNGGAGPFANVAGGQGLSKLRPPYVDGREEYDPATADVFEQRQTPPLFGLGLIESIPELEIVSNEDIADADGDGIRGVARRVMVAGVPEIGRFGWKAQVPRIRDFIHDAMANECGITTPDEGRGFTLVSDGDGVADPELSASQIDDMEFYLAELGAPQRKNPTDLGVLRGEVLFEEVGCAKCHVPSLMGANGPVNLYSDLLLHDVMPGTYRGMAETGAPAGFFRTTPLWGASESAPYMHDGSAETIQQAIKMHDGEAAGVRAAYNALDGLEKRALVGFVLDL